MPPTFTILGIPGSVRPQSYSRASLLAARQLAPPGVALEIFDLQGIPALSTSRSLEPAPRVAELKRRIRAADAIVFAAPEYLYSVLTVLDNAIESAAQPLHDNAWAGKHVAVIGASVASHGAARAQHNLRRGLVALNMQPIDQSTVMISSARRSFDVKGQLIDKNIRAQIAQLLADLVNTASSDKSAGDGIDDALPPGTTLQACGGQDTVLAQRAAGQRPSSTTSTPSAPTY